MKAFRFLIPPGQRRPLPSNPRIEVSGYFAVVIAESEPEARERLVAVFRDDGESSMWLEVADVRECDLVDGAVLIRGAF